MAEVLTDRRRAAALASSARSDRRHLALYRPVDARPGASYRRPAARPSGTACAARRRRQARRFEPAVYRRRRLLAGGLLLLSVAAVLVLAQLIQAGIGGGPLTTTGAAAGSGLVPAGATEYVVQPGDTLWSIAAALSPGRDERPMVDRLAAEVHGTALYPGEVIPVPSGR